MNIIVIPYYYPSYPLVIKVDTLTINIVALFTACVDDVRGEIHQKMAAVKLIDRYNW